MPRLALPKIEEALRNPAAFRRHLDNGDGGTFGETYVGALRQTIYRYHRNNDDVEAHDYLQHRLEGSARLRNASRIFDTLAQLDWYVEDHKSRGWATFQAPLRLSIQTSPTSELTCTGELVRLDLVPSGGYAAWILANGIASDWVNELRFPLIQRSVASETLGISAEEVQVGICDPTGRQSQLHQYSPRQLTTARRRFERLIGDLGF